MMSEVARKILSKDPAAEAQRKKNAEEAKTSGGQYHGTSSKADPKVRTGDALSGMFLLKCAQEAWNAECVFT